MVDRLIYIPNYDTQNYPFCSVIIVIIFYRDSLEDPLEDLGMVSQQLEQLSVIGKNRYLHKDSL